MLNQVLHYLNRSFYSVYNTASMYGYKTYSNVIEYSYSKDITFTSNDTLTGDFTDTFLAGEYIKIIGSRLNDGVYLISAIDDTTITIDATLDITITTEEEISCTMNKCFIPSEVIALIAEIKTYNTNTDNGIASESQGSRSVSYGTMSGWQGAFKSRLSSYKKVRW